MNKKQKRFLLIGSLVILLIIAGIAGSRYIPFSKLWKVSSVPESEFIKQPDRVEVPNTLSYDFEVDPKSGNTSGLQQGNAHSGLFSAKAFGKNSYSIAIDRIAGQLGVNPLNAAAVSTWVYVFPTKNDVNGAFVFSVNNELGVNVCWKSVGVSGPAIPQGKWFKISGLFDLSDIKWKPEYKIQIYFWNNSSTDILVDDYFIVFGKGTERRGDSTWVDMTKGVAHQPVFNKPPYPVVYLEAVTVESQSSVYLFLKGSEKAGRIGPSDRLMAGHFSSINDGLDDLLIVRTNGLNECFHFSKDKGCFEKVPIATPPGKQADPCLIENPGKGLYVVKTYDPGKKGYVSLFSGKTIGADTLKPSDHLFLGITDARGKSHQFRYNRDWRYDFKEILFNDTTFQILANIDFTGYELDHNPKYYEALTIVTGKFFSPSSISFCVVAGNCRKAKGTTNCKEWANLPELPDKVQFFNYPEGK
jgi:hypothetical protein